jgi:glycosyltransferase involved in cell wall biosynthesis
MSGPRTLLVIGDDARHRAGERPRRDFDLLAEHLGADVLHAGELEAPHGRTRTGIALARRAAQRSSAYGAIYCDSEHIGIPLAWMLRGKRDPRLTVLAHYLTPWKKRTLIRASGASRRIDALIVHSQAQADRAHSLGFDQGKVSVTPYQVDTRFWQPAGATPDCIASAGREFRDYLTLMRAASGLPVDVRIASGSHWSSRRSTFRAADVPPNVTLGPRTYAELRDLYASAHFVVVPLVDVDFQAGIITILEAMAMGKAVIVSRTRGQRGVVSGPMIEGGAFRDIGEAASEQNGIYVPPASPDDLRDAIDYLLAHPDAARSMGAAGRRLVEREMPVELFAERLAERIVPPAPRRVYAMPVTAS